MRETARPGFMRMVFDHLVRPIDVITRSVERPPSNRLTLALRDFRHDFKPLYLSSNLSFVLDAQQRCATVPPLAFPHSLSNVLGVCLAISESVRDGSARLIYFVLRQFDGSAKIPEPRPYS
jgi:hypothetical protein